MIYVREKRKRGKERERERERAYFHVGNIDTRQINIIPGPLNSRLLWFSYDVTANFNVISQMSLNTVHCQWLVKSHHGDTWWKKTRKEGKKEKKEENDIIYSVMPNVKNKILDFSHIPYISINPSIHPFIHPASHSFLPSSIHFIQFNVILMPTAIQFQFRSTKRKWIIMDRVMCVVKWRWCDHHHQMEKWKDGMDGLNGLKIYQKRGEDEVQ